MQCQETSEEEEDNLHRSTKRPKESHDSNESSAKESTKAKEADGSSADQGDGRRSYRDTLWATLARADRRKRMKMMKITRWKMI